MMNTDYRSETWYDPRLEVRESEIHGRGLFATAPILAGEVVMVWGGVVYTQTQLQTAKLEGGWSYSIVDETHEPIYLFAPADGIDYFINHSCEPNIWLMDAVTLVARSDIVAGQEMCGDYGLWECEAGWSLLCECGAEVCRGTITGEDYLQPELQERYSGHFMPFLTRRFERIRSASSF